MDLTSERNRLDEPSMASTTGFMTSAHSAQFNGGTYNVGGRDVHNHYHLREPQLDIRSILRAIPNFRDVHQDTLAKATKGTGMWVLISEYFRVWLDPNGDIVILWGAGNAGAGKTVLAAIVINYLETLATTDDRLCVAYVYIRYSNSTEVTIRYVLEILVKQIVERHERCLPIAEKAYAQHIRENTQPTEAQLLELLQQFAEQMRITVYALDALDEAPTAIQLALLKKLSSIEVKLFITSRPLKIVQAHFPNACVFPISAQDQDLDLHIAEEIGNSAELQELLGEAGSPFRIDVAATIRRKCGGMFLHASLQLSALRSCTNIREVERTLEGFPPRIEDVYMQTWKRVLHQSPNHVALAKSVLLWVLNASRSMTIDELRHAVATCPDTHHYDPKLRVTEATLLTVCRGLVTLEEESQLVRLVHYTAKETLTQLLLKTFPHPHSILTSVCTTHLTDCDFQDTSIASDEDLDRALAADPLLAYAYEAWAFHGRASLDVEATAAQLATFVTQCKAFPYVIDRWSFDLLGPLHVTVSHDLPFWLVYSGAENPNIRTAHKGRTPLALACSLGYEARVRELLLLPNVCVNNTDANRRSALMEACQHGRKSIVELLLAHPDTKVNGVDNYARSAFMLACVYSQEVIVELLLALPDTNVNSVDNGGQSALMAACWNGDESIVKILLAHPDTNVNNVDNNRRSALILACQNGCESIVKLLACSNTNVNGIDIEGRSAFTVACENGYESIAKFLLAHPDTKADIVDKDGVSTFMLACENGHESLVKLLLSLPDTKVDAVDNDGWSAFMLACWKGHESIAKLLLARPDTKVDGVDNKGWSALMLACENGHESLVKLLLAYPDVKVFRSNPHGTTALLVAAEFGHSNVVKLLLTLVPDIDVNPVDGDGDTAIKMAAEKGYGEIVRVLLETPGIDVTVPSVRTGRTALSAALANGHSEIIQLLRDFYLRSGIPMPAPPIAVASSDSENTVPLDDELGDACEDVPGSDADGSDAFEDALEEL